MKQGTQINSKVISDIPKEVMDIINKLQENNYEAYIVGGSVRDLYLGLEPKDWDITTDAKPEGIVALFPRTFYENDYGTVGVVSYETDTELENIHKSLHVIEVTPYRSESEYTDGRHPDKVEFGVSLEKDLSRRDFTINAIAYNPVSHETIDPFNGLKDIENKAIRAVGLPLNRFEEDSLRLLRAIRLSVQLGFNISHETLEAIKISAEGINKVSSERIRDEIVKLLMTDTPMIGFLTLEYTGLLEYIIPELRLGIGMKQTVNHSYDVWGHLLRSMQCAADKNYSLDLRLAALLHDIAKPHTARPKNKDENTFYNHEVVGAKVSREILNRLKFPKDRVERVTKLIRWHMFFSDPDQITMSAVRRMIANVGQENIWDLMDLRICDRIGTGRPKEDPYRLRKYHAMIEECLRDPIDLKMLKINGLKIMEVSREIAGPKIGLVLNALMGEVLEDPRLNTEEALVSRATFLIELNIKELTELAKKGLIGLKEADEIVVSSINKKHKVR